VDKFGRNYLLTVQTNEGKDPVDGTSTGLNSTNAITVRAPLTLELDIQRSQLSSANTSRFRIYNLAAVTRNKILQDQQDQFGLQVTLSAGYGTGPTWPLIFAGVCKKSTSFREGINFVSQLECFDGGNVYTSAIADGIPPFPAGSSKKSIIESLVGLLSGWGVQPGLIGDISGTVSRAYPVSGSIIDAIQALAGPNSFFIDNGRAYVLQTGEGIGAPEVALISSATGLLGTPTREETLLNLEVLFEPTFHIGQIISLQSSTGANYNGQYKIASVSHRGIISEAVCGDLVTNITLFYQKQIKPVFP
jgi:hypothetical protein